MRSRLRLLIVDDDERVRRALERALLNVADVTTVDGADGALEILAREVFDAIVTDLEMPGRSGAWLLEQVHATCPTVRRVLMSGHLVTPSASPGRPIEAFLPKPFTTDQLRGVLDVLVASGK